MLGESAVGKSSLVLRFVKGQFHEYQESTIGGRNASMARSNMMTPDPTRLCVASFLTQTLQLDESIIKFEIWDTAGQERYHSLAPMYYRGAQAALVVYDITNMVGTPYPYACLSYLYCSNHVTHSMPELTLGHLQSGQGLGQGTSKTGQSKYCDCPGGK